MRKEGAPDQPERDDRQRTEAVWRSRADRLSKRPIPAVAAQEYRQVIVLGLASERYAVDLPDVAEVLPAVAVTPVPGAAAAIAGVINVHGAIRPVMDLRRLLGIGPIGHGDHGRVILLRCAGREMGLRIDSVGEIAWIDPKELQSAGDRNVDNSACILSKYIEKSTGDLLMLLSTEALYAELDATVPT